MKAQGGPTKECYTWQSMKVLTGGQTGQTGYVNLVRGGRAGTSCQGL